jgi:hypothetical protein
MRWGESEAFVRQYRHDYGQIYAKEAKVKGPLIEA